MMAKLSDDGLQLQSANDSAVIWLTDMAMNEINSPPD